MQGLLLGKSALTFTENNAYFWGFCLLQGPLPNTCGHFWEMVWEQKSRGVVMLNRVMEKGSVSIHPVLAMCSSHLWFSVIKNPSKTNPKNGMG